MTAPSISDQAIAVELAAVNQAGHAANLAALAEKGKRTPEEAEMAASRVPALEAAAKTLTWLAKNADAVRGAIKKEPGQ